MMRPLYGGKPTGENRSKSAKGAAFSLHSLVHASRSVRGQAARLTSMATMPRVDADLNRSASVV